MIGLKDAYWFHCPKCAAENFGRLTFVDQQTLSVDDRQFLAASGMPSDVDAELVEVIAWPDVVQCVECWHEEDAEIEE